MPLLSAEDIAKAKALTEKATPGPWRVDGEFVMLPVRLGGEDCSYALSALREDDCDFIASARSFMPAAIADLEEMRIEVARLKRVEVAARALLKWSAPMYPAESQRLSDALYALDGRKEPSDGT